MLIVVEDRDVANLFEALFDLEAAGRGDILEVDAAEAARKQADGVHDVVNALGAHAEREGVDVAERFEERALALHDGHARLRPDVAETQNRGAVRDDRDEVRAASVNVGKIDVLGDLEAGFGNAGRVGDRKLFTVGDGRAGHDLDLALPFFVLFECKLLLIHNK